MKSSSGSSRGLARDFWADANRIAALTGSLAVFAPCASGQIVLDDYSVSKEGNYDYVQVLGSPADGWNVSSGELRPTIAGLNATGAWLWNRGEKLSAVGDSVSIDLSLPGEASNGLGTGIGLFFAKNLNPPQGTGFEVGLFATQGSYVFNVGLGSVTGVPSSGLLTVQMTVQTPTTSTYSVSYGPQSSFAIFQVDSDSAFFGPEASNTATTAAALDNLTFTTVPEPSAYTAVFGALALAASLAGPCRRRRSRTVLR